MKNSFLKTDKVYAAIAPGEITAAPQNYVASNIGQWPVFEQLLLDEN